LYNSKNGRKKKRRKEKPKKGKYCKAAHITASDTATTHAHGMHAPYSLILVVTAPPHFGRIPASEAVTTTMKLVFDGIRAAAVVIVVAAAAVIHGTRPHSAVPQFVAREGAVVVVEGEGGVPLRMRELAAAAAAISAAVCGRRGHLGGPLGLLEAFYFRELTAAGVDEPVGDLVWLGLLVRLLCFWC
jgi:hypothetical protein